MSHTCSLILIHCMDFRLIDKTRKWMQDNGWLGDCDVISFAGAAKSIVDGNEKIREFLLAQIEISCSLHQAHQVILVHHSDCGAYKASYNFKTPEEEREKQLEDMAKSEKIIKNKFPQVKVKKVWVEMNNEEGKNVNFNII